MSVPAEATFLHSSFYEQLVEHVFVSEVIQECWFRHGQRVEVLRSEIDASGYDLVMECNGFLRHIQLKTSRVDSRTAQQKVNIALAEKPSGCVVWMLRRRGDDARVKLTYRFFGAGPGERLPSLEGFRTARHTKANAEGHKAERPAIRVLPKSRFESFESTEELVERLFGLTDAGEPGFA